jgi:hypothetical protein
LQKNIENFSYSKINIYNNCERKYDYIYNKKFPRKNKTFNSIRGHLLHDLIEHDIQGLSYIPEYDVQTSDVFTYEDFLNTLKEYKKISQNNIVKKLKELYLKFLENFKIENKLEFPNKNFNFIGFVDTLIINGNKIAIIDYKTGEIFEEYTQLEYYAVMASKIYKETEEYILTLSFISKNEEKIKIIKKEDLLKIEKNLIKKIEKILKTKKYRKNVTPLCNYCEYEDICLYNSKLDLIEEEIREIRDYLPSGLSSMKFYEGYLGSEYLILLNQTESETNIINNLENNFWKEIENKKMKKKDFFISVLNFYTYKDTKKLEDIYIKLFKKINLKFFKILKQKKIIINSKETLDYIKNLFKISNNEIYFEHNKIIKINDFYFYCIDFKFKNIYL